MKNRLFKRISTAVVAFAMVFCAGVTGVGVPKASAATINYVTSLTSGNFYTIKLATSTSDATGYYFNTVKQTSGNPRIKATLNRNGVPKSEAVRFKLVKSGSAWKLHTVDDNGKFTTRAIGLNNASGAENNYLKSNLLNTKLAQTFKIAHTGSGKFTIQSYDSSISAYNRFVTAANLNSGSTQYDAILKKTKTSNSYWYFIPA